MKKLLLFSYIIGNSLFAQNGITSYPMPAGYPNFRIAHKTGITIDNSGNAWVGFKTNVGIGKFDGTTWTMFDTTNTPMTTANITALGTQSGSIIWAASSLTNSTGELFSYNGSSWTDYSSQINFHYTNAIVNNAISGNMWIATNAGLYKYNGTWTNFTVANSGLASDTVLSLAIDPSGNVLAGTMRGLSVQYGNTWTNYSSSTIAFPSNVITAVYSDAVNGTWVSSGGRVGIFSPPYFEPMDSLMLLATSSYPNQNISIARGPNGGVIFGGNDGSLIEVIDHHPKFYYVGISRVSYLAYNPVNGETWFVNQYSPVPGYPLFAFNGNYVHQLGEGFQGVTADNARLLDINNVSMALLNDGTNNDSYQTVHNEEPKGSTASCTFFSGLWIGGMDNGGNLHEAAMTYRENGMDFYPGPLDTIYGTTDSTVAGQYDYMWKITKMSLQEFQYNWSIGAVQNGTFQPDPDIITWPANGTGNHSRNLAPFIDVDGNGIYNPLTGGDYPVMKGDEMLYCIFNDNLTAHGESGSVPMKVEIHETSYAFYCPSVADSEKAINYTVYHDYEIFNRSNSDYHSVYVGTWDDDDLGQFTDDYTGCISTENFSFICNAEVNDGNNPFPQLGTYGAHPPIESHAILDGPVAEPSDGIDNDNDGTIDETGEKNLMTGFVYFYNDWSPMGNPEHADDYYLYLSGKWKDSTNLTYGGNGYGGITPTHFMFNGLMYDTTAWTEKSMNDWLGDRRGLTSCGPFDMRAGEHVHFLFADIFTRDTTVGPPDTLYYDQAVNDVRRVRRWYEDNSELSCIQWNVGTNELSADQALLLSLYPNPASTALTIKSNDISGKACYEVYDLTGKIIQNGIISGAQTVISVENLSAGIYLVRVIDNDKVAAKKFIRE
jgi:hypothetical protein